jgi:hypothetical protein
MSLNENPATLAACGALVTDQAGGSINSDNSHSTRALQASRIIRRCAISAATADALAPLVFGEASP